MKALKSSRGIISVILILTCILQVNYVKAAAASIIDVGSVASRGYDQDIAEILTYRNTESSPILQKATIIFQTKLSDSTPLQDAALELLKSCKAAEELSTHTTSSDSVKDAAKSTYAIKAALISLASASVRGPSTCDAFGVQSNRFTFLAAVTGTQAQSPPPSSSDRSLCVRDLYKTDNSWTSYSNALQDANTLCQVPSLENAQRAILDLLNDMNNIIPAWLDIFDQKQKAHYDFMQQQRAYAEDLEDLQRRQREGMEDNHEAANSAMTSMMDATKSHLHAMTNSLREELDATGFGLDQIRKAVDDYILDFFFLKDDQTRIFQAYQSTFTDAMAIQSRNMNEIQDVVQGAVQSLNHVFGGLEEQVHAVSTALRSQMHGLLQLQGELEGGQEELLEYQASTIQHQKEMSAFASQLKGQVADMVTTLSKLNGTIESLGKIVRGEVPFKYRAALFSFLGLALLWALGLGKLAYICFLIFVMMWLSLPLWPQLFRSAYYCGYIIARGLRMGLDLLATINVRIVVGANLLGLVACGIAHFGRKPQSAAAPVFVNEPKVKVKQHHRGHGFRAATVPPRPTPLWSRV